MLCQWVSVWFHSRCWWQLSKQQTNHTIWHSNSFGKVHKHTHTHTIHSRCDLESGWFETGLVEWLWLCMGWYTNNNFHMILMLAVNSKCESISSIDLNDRMHNSSERGTSRINVKLPWCCCCCCFFLFYSFLLSVHLVWFEFHSFSWKMELTENQRSTITSTICNKRINNQFTREIWTILSYYMWPLIIYLVYLKHKHTNKLKHIHALTHTHITFPVPRHSFVNGALTLVSLIYPFKYNMCVRSVKHFVTSFFPYRYPFLIVCSAFP